MQNKELGSLRDKLTSTNKLFITNIAILADFTLQEKTLHVNVIDF